VLDIRANENLIPADRDSMVNMGENVTKDNIRELRKMKQEIVEPNLGKGPTQLLPKVE
jgi:ATP-dependent protease HslVU (ClpYQ) peptidase subunit